MTNTIQAVILLLVIVVGITYVVKLFFTPVHTRDSVDEARGCTNILQLLQGGCLLRLTAGALLLKALSLLL